MITLDCVLRKGAQSNWREKQARICVLCDAFCSHTALPPVKGVHQPRDCAVFFFKTNAALPEGPAFSFLNYYNHSGSKATTADIQLTATNSRNSPPPFSHRSTINSNSKRTQAVKGGKGEGSSTQTAGFTVCETESLT